MKRKHSFVIFHEMFFLSIEKESQKGLTRTSTSSTTFNKSGKIK